MAKQEKNWTDGADEHTPEVGWRDAQFLGTVDGARDAVGHVHRVTLKNDSVLIGEVNAVHRQPDPSRIVEMVLYLFPNEAIGAERGRVSIWGSHIQSVERQVSALPTRSGPYFALSKPPHGPAGAWTTDGYDFHYLNEAGNWVDIGFGQPSLGDRLIPLEVSR